MAFKRYIHKHGKKLGPYYYENIRSPDGKVKTVYIGTNPHHHPKHRIKKPLIFLILALVLVLILGSLLFFMQNKSYLIKKVSSKEPDFEIDQILLKVLVRSGEYIEKQIRVMNTGSEQITINIEASGLSDIVKIGSSSFAIKPGQTKIVNLNFSSFIHEQNIIESPGIYVGKLIVKSEKAARDVPIVVEIETKNVLFDMNLNPVAIERKVKQGSDTTIEVRVFNLESIESVNVDVEYFVKDINGNTIITESETVVVKTQASFFKTISIPKNLKPGPYIFAAQARLGNSIGTASYLFEVIGPEEQTFLQFCKNNILCMGLSLTTILLLFALTAYFYFFIGAYIYERVTGSIVIPKKKKEESETGVITETAPKPPKAKVETIEEKRAEEPTARKQSVLLAAFTAIKNSIKKRQKERERRLKKERVIKERSRLEEELQKLEEARQAQLEIKRKKIEEEKARQAELKRQEEIRKQKELEEQRAEEQRKREEELRKQKGIKAKQKEEDRKRKELEKEKLRKERRKKVRELLHKIGLYKTPEEKKQIALQREKERQERLKKQRELERKKIEEEKARQAELKRQEEIRKQKELEEQRAEGQRKREEELRKQKEIERQRQELEQKKELEEQRKEAERRQRELERKKIEEEKARQAELKRQEEIRKQKEIETKQKDLGKKEPEEISGSWLEDLFKKGKKEAKELKESDAETREAEYKEKIVKPSKKLEKFNRVLNEVNQAIEKNDISKVDKLYTKATNLYVNLPSQEQKEIYGQLMGLYKKRNQLMNQYKIQEKNKEKEKERKRKELEKEKLRKERRKKVRELLHKIGLYKTPEEKKQIALQREKERQEKEKRRQEESRLKEELRKQRELERKRLEEEKARQAELKRQKQLKKKQELERQKAEEEKRKKEERLRKQKEIKAKQEEELRRKKQIEEEKARQEEIRKKEELKKQKELERQKKEQIKTQKFERIKQIEAKLGKNNEITKKLNSEIEGLESENKILSRDISETENRLKRFEYELLNKSREINDLSQQKNSLNETYKKQLDGLTKNFKNEKQAKELKAKEIKAKLADMQNSLMKELYIELGKLPPHKRKGIEKWKKLEIKAKLKIEEQKLQDELKKYDSKDIDKKRSIEADYRESLEEINKKQRNLHQETIGIESQKKQVLIDKKKSAEGLLKNNNKLKMLRIELEAIAKEQEKLSAGLSQLKSELPKPRWGFFSKLKLEKESQREIKIPEEITAKSKDLGKCHRLLQDAKGAFDKNDINKAKKLYAEARELYVSLPTDDKRKVYDELINLYNMLKR